MVHKYWFFLVSEHGENCQSWSGILSIKATVTFYKTHFSHHAIFSRILYMIYIIYITLGIKIWHWEFSIKHGIASVEISIV